MAQIFALDLFPLKRRPGFTRERDEFLRENHGVDPAILADSLGVIERFVIGYQRKLGLRKCVASGIRGPR